MLKICPSCNQEFQTFAKYQKCCSYKCAVNIRPYKSIRDNIVDITCDFQLSNKCKKSYKTTNRNIWKNRTRNNGKFICLYCSRTLKFSGRNNPNTRYKNMNDNFFEEIKDEKSAYLLGWIASDGHISNGTIVISIKNIDGNMLVLLKNIIDSNIPVKKLTGTNQFSITFNSQKMSQDVCKLLKINPGKKSDIVQFPELSNEYLKWCFLRGYFDGDGCIVRASSSKRSPVCSISSQSHDMLQSIKDFCGIPCSISGNNIEWYSNNCLDFLSKLYDNASVYLQRKRDLYIDWSVYVPGLGGKYNSGYLEGLTIKTKWIKTRKDAVAPSKEHASDSGFDLTIIDKVKSFGENTILYTTGIKIEPDYGWYYDVVPRSSISKTGYMMANSIGVIDRTYRGEIMIALIKIDPSMPDIELPYRIAQMIPRPIINVEFIEITDELEQTNRNEGGFGSTNKD